MSPSTTWVEKEACIEVPSLACCASSQSHQLSKTDDQLSFICPTSTSTPNKTESGTCALSASNNSRHSITPFKMGLSGSFSIPSYAGAHCSSITPVTSVARLQQVTSSGWHLPAPFSPLTFQGMDTLSSEQAAEAYQLSTECQALGSNLAKWFQTLCRLEAMHHAMAQATAHETVHSGCIACSAAYGVTTTTKKAEEWESTLRGLHEEANKAWKDANDIIFSHLLKCDPELVTFLTSAEDTLRNKCEEIWRCIHNLTETVNFSPQAGLSPALQVLSWLLNIPWDLSYHVGIPMMFAYGPELYELWSWGAAGDGAFNLDSHIQAANLLSHKLVCMYSRVGPHAPSPNRIASPTGSATLCSPMPSPSRSHSHSKTPSHGTKLVRSQSHSVSSTSSQAVELKPPAGSGGNDSKGSKSTCQGDSETDEEDRASPGGKAPGDGEGQDSESSNVESYDDSEITDATEPKEDHDKETKGTSSKTEGSDSESSSSSLESDIEIPA